MYLNVYLFIDLVKRGMLKLASEIRRYKNGLYGVTIVVVAVVATTLIIFSITIIIISL